MGLHESETDLLSSKLRSVESVLQLNVKGDLQAVEKEGLYVRAWLGSSLAFFSLVEQHRGFDTRAWSYFQLKKKGLSESKEKLEMKGAFEEVD